MNWLEQLFFRKKKEEKPQSPQQKKPFSSSRHVASYQGRPERRGDSFYGSPSDLPMYAAGIDPFIPSNLSDDSQPVFGGGDFGGSGASSDWGSSDSGSSDSGSSSDSGGCDGGSD